MWHIFTIFSVVAVIFLLGIWSQFQYSVQRNRILEFKNDEPFDNFRYFNDLEEIEENTSCHPFIIGPRQSDLIQIINPVIFSCNSPMKKWANFSNGKLTISEKLNEKRKRENNQNFTCVYTEIIAGDELSNGTILVESSLNETIIESGIPTEIPYEQFVVFCREPSGNHFYNKTFFNFIQKSEKNPSSETIGKTNGLMIFSISGMSHNQAFRHMKQTLKLAAKNDFQSFSMFNQESNNNWNNSMKSFGNNQKIWDSARDNSGSVSFLHTDSSEFSKLFGNQFDYHPNLYNYFNQQYLGHVDNCISDGSVTVEDSVSLWINFTRTFRDHSSYFSLLHLTKIASPKDGKVANLDEILNISLEELIRERVFENTTIVILSDGGTENSSVFNKESGKIESKYGLFLIRIADNFKEQHQKETENLKKNVDRLITNKDVSETLHFLISKWKNSENLNSINGLFGTHFYRNRTCSTAGISQKSCICSKKVEIEDYKKKEVVDELMNVLKKEFSEYKCITEIKLIQNEFDIRNYGSIHFFKFQGFLMTERVKISDIEGFSNSTKIHFSGKVRFSMRANLGLELRQRLKLILNKKKDEQVNRTFDRCYLKIIKDFERNS